MGVCKSKERQGSIRLFFTELNYLLARNFMSAFANFWPEMLHNYKFTPKKIEYSIKIAVKLDFKYIICKQIKPLQMGIKFSNKKSRQGKCMGWSGIVYCYILLHVCRVVILQMQAIQLRFQLEFVRNTCL